ncbi:ArdC-like ssDNA-binding domain-containing protein [Methanobacterium spitsbergense]|uniref:SsDNA-binding domain-containing protein n=1 Tax=Methanobacterium spitsbergense TaxID=2874285 RepID=A0A8T5UMS7_9EURY|nr:ArdC family protein [Methanobacterium spitsbergense]MBZ2165212.1 ssDNA-binding domain-containing protein [Methanobacterium spitsbergense]
MDKIEIPRKLKGQELTKFLTEKLDELADEICQSEEQLWEFIKKWTRGFHSYSFNNTILAWIQRPDFTLLAGYKAWQGRERQVKKGERAIRILAPMVKKIKEDNGDETCIIRGFHPVSVFDIAQTEGDEIEELGCPELVSGNFDFETIVKASPVPVLIRYLGVSNGQTDGNTIKIAPKKNQAAMVATAIHEWAHVALGHCESSGTLFEIEDKSAKEIEAETVSFIVSSVLGLENNKSRLYIGNWGGNKKELQGRGKKIIAVAESIIKAINALE